MAGHGIVTPEFVDDRYDTRRNFEEELQQIVEHYGPDQAEGLWPALEQVIESYDLTLPSPTRPQTASEDRTQEQQEVASLEGVPTTQISEGNEATEEVSQERVASPRPEESDSSHSSSDSSHLDWVRDWMTAEMA